MMYELEIWISMNEDGDFIVSKESDNDAAEMLASELGGAQCRTVRLTVKMRAPEAAEADVTVPNESPAELTAST